MLYSTSRNNSVNFGTSKSSCYFNKIIDIIYYNYYYTKTKTVCKLIITIL